MYFQQTCTVLICAAACVVQYVLDNKAGPRAVSGQCVSVSFVLSSMTIARKGDVDIRNGIVTVALHSSLVVRNVSQQVLANRLFHI